MFSKHYVIKRDGRQESLMFDKITSRIERLCYGLNKDFIDPVEVTKCIIAGIYPGVTTVELDTLAAETCAYKTTQHPDYAILAARIAMSNLHKETKKVFSEVMNDLYNHTDKATGKKIPLISDKTIRIINANADRLNSAIVYERDFFYQYFGFKTLERSYLLRLNDVVVERPQHLIMRVAVGIHEEDIDRAIETYNLMSQGWFVHATPTLFNAGTPLPQLASCFLMTMKDDSVEGIFETVKTCALISKTAGGIGLAIQNVRSDHSYIAGTNGYSNGIIPMLRLLNNVARHVQQGGNKRPGSFAVYLEPWHPDVFEFLDLRKNTGKEEQRARDLFYALWVCDLFMKRCESDSDWSLFNPNEAPDLDNTWGEEFEALYEKYEREGRAKKTIKARELWFAIIESQVETGTPFILYKDACNMKSNQKNLGTIKCSNLCTEIVEYTAPDEVAVCNLGSVALPAFVIQSPTGPVFDHNKLYEVTRTLAYNLNKVIDVTYYPVPEARKSNMRHRPIGIGAQGLADAFIKMRYPFDSPQARVLNREIFETIYYAAVSESVSLAEKFGCYETYPGSPASQGILQYDMWNVTPSPRWDWAALKMKMAKHGLRNSLLVAPMPTASTAQILGNNESIEPYTSNIYTRRVLSGEFQVVNQHLLKELTQLGLWTDDMKNRVVAANGSIANISNIPRDIKELYKTVWEISQKSLIDMAADRGAFVCQSQSFNVHMAEPNIAKMTSMHFYAWNKGLKTGMYYLRSRPAAQAIQFTVDQLALKAGGKKTKEQKESEEALLCSLQNKDDCVMCSG